MEEDAASFFDFKASSTSKRPLGHTWTLWFSSRAGPRARNYEDNIKAISDFSTVEDFWGTFSHIAPVGELPFSSDYHLFKKGIKPMWEDDANKRGGKWIVRLRKGLASRFWEDLVLAMIGEQFDVGEEICGAVISVRFNEDIISIWNRTNAPDITLKIRDTLRRVLGMDPSTTVEYKDHDSSLRDNSSFRNTDVYR